MKVLAFPGPKQRLPDDPIEQVEPPAPRPVFSGETPPPKYDRITIRAITVAIVLSLLVHLVVLLLPAFNQVNKDEKLAGDESPLKVQIASSKPPPPGPEPKPEPPPEAKVTPTPTPPRPVTKPRPQTPQRQSQIAIDRGPRPPFVVPPPVVQQPPTPPQPQPTPQRPTQDDFASELAARQAARRAANGGAPDEVLESDNERANRIAKANILGQARSQNPGQDPNQSGGIFELKNTGITDAEFVFNGWNQNFQRGIGETHDVRVPPGGDIRLQVIREMIAIIRKQRPDTFDWHSHRLNKVITMSARVQDQPELEIFLMKEFYPQDPRAQGR